MCLFVSPLAKGGGGGKREKNVKLGRYILLHESNFALLRSLSFLLITSFLSVWSDRVVCRSLKDTKRKKGPVSSLERFMYTDLVYIAYLAYPRIPWALDSIYFWPTLLDAKKGNRSWFVVF